jgi:hypothetical protein
MGWKLPEHWLERNNAAKANKTHSKKKSVDSPRLSTQIPEDQSGPDLL